MPASKFWIGTSWKMNKTLGEAIAFANTLGLSLAQVDDRIQPFVIPSFTAVREVKSILSATRVKVGAQNMHWDDSGAWTGEISPLMLKDCDLDMVELGHSERRQHFGETNETVGLKTAAAVRHGLTPLICIGETRAERDEGRTEDVLTVQVQTALRGLEGAARDATILLAYEPVWAIGKDGVPASADYADRQHALIRQVAARALTHVPAILYGGSVNAANCVELASQPNIDGLFVGRSAWEADDLLDIISRCATTLKQER